MVWDNLLELNLFSPQIKKDEIAYYKKRIHAYGLPLDNRSDYTKSDWMVWCAAMAENKQVSHAIMAAIACFLKESSTRVAFSDWYDTKTGDYCHCIARSVQGGLYMPFLMQK